MTVLFSVSLSEAGERYSSSFGGGSVDRVQEPVTFDGVGEVRGGRGAVGEIVADRRGGVRQSVNRCSGQMGVFVVAVDEKKESRS